MRTNHIELKVTDLTIAFYLGDKTLASCQVPLHSKIKFKKILNKVERSTYTKQKRTRTSIVYAQ